MIGPRIFFRLMHIGWVLIRHGLDDLILDTHMFRPIRYLRYLIPWLWIKHEWEPRAIRLRNALEELGPLFVKFGQMLSTRRDLLPGDIAKEFAHLQDQVRPFPGERAKQIIEQVFAKDIDVLFTQFNEQPLASASIAQVHAATLPNGRHVVVKVVRPNIEKIIRRDLQLLYTIADMAWRYWPEARRLRPKEVVAEFEKTLLDELDLVREAANASQLRRNFLNSPLLYVPEIEWALTQRTVMVMERIYGIPISDFDALHEAGIDLEQLSVRGVEIFFTQVFRHRFFHADMHPGNIFVSKQGQYIAVDFGIMGSLGPDDQNYLAQNFLAFFNRDYKKVAQLHIESGWVPRSTRVDEFEAAIRTVCEPIFQRPLKDISFGHFLLHLFQTARRFNMEVQPQLVLLQKTLLNIEGLGRQLNPNLDLWQSAKPFLEKWVWEQSGPVAMAKQVASQLPKWVALLPELSDYAHQFILQQRASANYSGKERRRVGAYAGHGSGNPSRVVAAILGGASLIATALVYGLDGPGGQNYYGVPVLSWLFGVSGIIFVFLALGDEK